MENESGRKMKMERLSRGVNPVSVEAFDILAKGKFGVRFGVLTLT